MESTQPKTRVNPLTSLMRQPKLYIKLPSNGQFWPEGSLNVTLNGDYPVYSMTAKDELLLKTPDALMNGQAVVDVIQNCLPNIVDAWQVPAIDLDVILVAIRLATYGEKMEMTIDVGMETDFSYSLDLRTLLDQLMNTITWDGRIEIGQEMVLHIKPASYMTVSKSSIQNFEAQKILSIVNSSTLSEEEKVQTFRDSFKKLTDLTVGVITSSVYKIESTAGTTDDLNDIREFLDNCDKHVFDAIKQRLDLMRERNSLKPIVVQATPEMIANGSKETIEIPLTFDASNFFG